MPARIYTLAKELKIDSKELVDICAKAGITGKGSALASLADDEVDRLKEFLSGRGGRGGAARSAAGGGVAVAAPPDRHTREHYIPPAGVAGKPPVIEAPRKERPPELTKKPLEPRPTPKPSRGQFVADMRAVPLPLTSIRGR